MNLDTQDNSFNLFVGSNRSDIAPIYDFLNLIDFCRTVGYIETEGISDGFVEKLENQAMVNSIVKMFPILANFDRNATLKD